MGQRPDLSAAQRGDGAPTWGSCCPVLSAPALGGCRNTAAPAEVSTSMYPPTALSTDRVQGALAGL